LYQKIATFVAIIVFKCSESAFVLVFSYMELICFDIGEPYYGAVYSMNRFRNQFLLTNYLQRDNKKLINVSLI